MDLYTLTRRTRALVLTCILVLALAVSACSSPEQNLVGQWQEVDTPETFEFFNDNRVTITTPEGKSLSGKWSNMDDGRLKIDVFALGMTFTVTAEIEEGELVVHESGGNISRYKKL